MPPQKHVLMSVYLYLWLWMYVCVCFKLYLRQLMGFCCAIAVDLNSFSFEINHKKIISTKMKKLHTQILLIFLAYCILLPFNSILIFTSSIFPLCEIMVDCAHTNPVNFLLLSFYIIYILPFSVYSRLSWYEMFLPQFSLRSHLVNDRIAISTRFFIILILFWF